MRIVLALLASLLSIAVPISAASANCLLSSDPVELGSATDGAVTLHASGFRNAAVAWDSIAAQLESRGNELRGVEVRVVIYANVNFFVETLVVPYSADKLCGETLAQMAARIADDARGIGMGSTGPGGSSGGGMYIPTIVRWSGWSFSCTVDGVPISCEGY